METMIQLTSEPIREAELIAERDSSQRHGARVVFLGIVRGLENNQPIRGLIYEAHDAMARHQFGLLLQEIQSKWPIHSIQIVHRTGFVAAQEPSLWVEVKSAHRKEAFAACEYLIDRMKEVVPIWKKPVLAEGSEVKDCYNP